jgi:hypothetical protein
LSNSGKILAAVGVELGPLLFARGGVQLLKPGDITLREPLGGQK